MVKRSAQALFVSANLAVLSLLTTGFHLPCHAQMAASASPGPGKSIAVRNGKMFNKRVVDWFARYDGIRHSAQMNRSEKQNAHKLIKAAVSGNAADRAASATLLSSLSARYEKAIADLSRLPLLPETGELQSAYLKYFKTGNTFFKSYLKEMKGGPSPTALAQFHDARKELKTLDSSNKLLDRELRKKFNIGPYRWD